MPGTLLWGGEGVTGQRLSPSHPVSPSRDACRGDTLQGRAHLTALPHSPPGLGAGGKPLKPGKKPFPHLSPTVPAARMQEEAVGTGCSLAPAHAFCPALLCSPSSRQPQGLHAPSSLSPASACCHPLSNCPQALALRCPLPACTCGWAAFAGVLLAQRGGDRQGHH